MFLLDTNICIFAIKQKPEIVLQTIQANMDTGMFISTLTIAELEYGISNSMYPEKNRTALLEFLTIFDVLPFDDHDAIEYGKIKAILKKQGSIIGPIDLLLAAQAVSKKLTLVTNNVKEFQRVENLTIEDWTKK